MIRSYRQPVISNVVRNLSYLVFLLVISAHLASAQVLTGTPPFGSFGGGPDVINLANLNARLTIPVLHKPGRGTDFTYDLSYDSSVWYPLISGSTKSWQPVNNFGWRGQTEAALGYITRNTHHARCPVLGDGYNTTWDNYAYHDMFGTTHFFSGTAVSDCNGTITGFASGSTNGSGYTLTVADNTLVSTVISAAGKNTVPPVSSSAGAARSTDRNGNQISVSSTGMFTDTLGATALTVSGVAPSNTTFTYTAPSGTSTSYTMKYSTYTVQTKFGCPGISDYGPTSTSLVSEIDLPDGSKYSFTYEPTPGASGNVTGRPASVTLPTGGTISYQYSGGGTGVNGISCADGSAATLTRSTPDGTWTYAQAKGAGAASATLITAPKLPYDSAANQTIAQFQGIYETQRDTYQGPAPTFSSLPIAESTLQTANLLQEKQSCYNVSALPCVGTAVTLPITQRIVIATLPGSGNLKSQHTDKFDSYGNVTESDDYDFATAAPFPLLRQTVITYANLGAYLNAFAQIVTVKDGLGTIKSRQDTNYDQYSAFTGANCITGLSTHDDAGHGCTSTARGNATSVTSYTDPVTPGGPITKNFTYDSLGNLRTAQLNCCQLKTWAYSTTTGYAYPDSVTSGSSSPQLTTSFTYDLNMGLSLTSTDPNNVKTTLTYDNMGRTLTAKTGTNPTTNYTYNDYNNSSSFTPWTVQACSPVQGTNTACQKTILDGQGRAATKQLLDGGSILYSASDTQYDVLGRAYKESNPYTTSAVYWTQTNFDALGRTINTTLPDSSANSISYADNTLTTTDPSSKQRKAVSDGLGRLTSVYEPDPANSNTLTLQTSYVYNVFDQLTGATQGAQTRTFVYDALGS